MYMYMSGYVYVCMWGVYECVCRLQIYTVRPNKKETRFISEISSLPRKIETNCMLHYQEHFLFFHLIPNT